MNMGSFAGIDAMIAWGLLFGEGDHFLRDPEFDYAQMLERMEARELLALIDAAQRRLKELEGRSGESAPVDLYIDKRYSIRMGGESGPELRLRPMVKALFILFLKHPEGILLKRRGDYQGELEEIYGILAPSVSKDTLHRRIDRLLDLEGNAFSENTSALNARLDTIFADGAADDYKIQGRNGYPRKISLNPLLVHWGRTPSGRSEYEKTSL